ncbi:MAG: dihydroorotate dehydrogenase [Candidatus Omnitrophota bacterium]
MGSVDLSIQLGPLKLKNPVMVASGTASYGEELSRVYPLARLGGFVTKSITLKPREGNPPHRVIETASGMLNSIGLQNAGVEAFCKTKLPFLRKAKATVIVNIAAKRIEDYAALAKRLSEEEGIAALELNVSCPNVKEGGLEFGTNPKNITEIVRGVRRATHLPILTKLSPNVTDIVLMARAAMDGGSDAVSLVNTLLGMAVDVRRKKPVLSTVTGGLSGPAIKPVALRMDWQVYQALKCPIVGIGGIASAEDALTFMMAGAGAIQIGSASYTNPRAAMEILEDLEAYAKKEKLRCLEEVVGCLDV